MSDVFDLTDEPEREAPPPAPAAPGVPPYLDRLNEAQLAAVEAIGGPVLVLAGAGTGKTRVLIARLVHILTLGRAWPGQILAVTFTNKAAREMRERVGALVGGLVEGLWLGTFHALSVRILRRHAELLGLKSNFTILDVDDQIRLLKQVIAAADLDEKRWPARVLLGTIQGWKDRGLTPEKVDAGDVSEFAAGRSLELYAAYQERLRTLNACDFGDLLLHCLTLFTGHPDVLADYQRRFRYILVDEYQDTNVAQYLWLRLLAQGSRNICCVGDDDQSIYSWRGAEVGNILRFEKDFPGAQVIRLEQNYRSTQNILSAASGLIARNEGRLGKTLWTSGASGEKITVRGVWDGEEEARIVADEVERMQADGQSLDEVAILVRAGFQTREFEERFITLGVPYRVIGGPRFYERLEIRDAIAYLRVIHQPDDGLAFERIVNTPRRGIGDATMRIVHHLARTSGVSLPEAARRVVETDELKPRARRALAGLMEDFGRWRTVAGGMPQDELIQTVLEESGYTDMWQADKSPDAPGRLENLKELVAAIAEFESLEGFLEHVSLVMERNEGGDGAMVNLMTLHGAKGLEFDVVFLPGWEEGLFPHQRALDEGGAAALEEERRLAYVGLTRARHRAQISFAASRRIYNQWQSAIPSRFVEELPADHVEVVSAPGLYGAHGGAHGGASAAGGDEWALPGANAWGRRRAWSGVRPPEPTIDGQAREIETSAESESSFALGDRIFHIKFGYGRITAVEGSRLEIDFEKAGPKKVIDSFVERA